MSQRIPRSVVEGIAWPAIPSPQGASLLAMQFQLAQTQWWKQEALLHHQLQQLRALLAHAFETVPFYRERFSACGFDPFAPLDEESFRRLPMLSRQEVQQHGQRLLSKNVPPGHGTPREAQTSGSTGMPIHFLGTDVTEFLWSVFTLREHLWHRRDPRAKMVAIRPDREAPADTGQALANWGHSINLVFQTGPAAMLHSRTPIDRQVKWLEQQDPEYLISLPSNIHALAQEFGAGSARLPKLRQVRTYGETLRPEVRRACASAFNVPVVDMYSAQEVGYIALQCPDHEHYHVQAENVLVEILRDDGRPCVPGEVGKIVLTTLHNFAFPLIRYAIMDYAEVGPPCACGRGLPILKRILGRERNLATYPDGRRFYPTFHAAVWSRVAPIRQIQMIQKTRERIEVRLAMSRPLGADEQTELTRALQETLGYPFELSYAILDEIPRGPGGKYEDFICEVP